MLPTSKVYLVPTNGIIWTVKHIKTHLGFYFVCHENSYSLQKKTMLQRVIVQNLDFLTVGNVENYGLLNRLLVSSLFLHLLISSFFIN